MRAGLLSVVICLLASAGCTPREPSFAGKIYVSRAHGVMVIEQSPGTMVGLSTRDGSELWRYQAMFPQVDYLDLSARYSLACPIVETTNGHLLLRYDEQLHSISVRSGTRRWSINVDLFAAGRCRCVAVTPDSGVVLLRRSGLAVQKLDSQGQPVWSYQLVGLGAAVNPPKVVFPSGDTLVQTNSHVISISPQGALNWAVRRAQRAR